MNTKLLHLVSYFVGLLLLLNACSPAYVSSPPRYQQEMRPAQPSLNHVWIDGNWKYNRPTKTYNQGNGRWALPSRGRQYQSGEWKNNNKGYYWAPGKWK